MIRRTPSRLERLEALMADGWCPCRSSDDDAKWLGDSVRDLLDALKLLVGAPYRPNCDWNDGRPCHSCAARALIARVEDGK
jgi:hypothetical protein